MNYLRGAAGIGLASTINYRRYGQRPGQHDQVPTTHNERRRGQRP
jgi:hypothetical protein